jgi:hypothetical protein
MNDKEMKLIKNFCPPVTLTKIYMEVYEQFDQKLMLYNYSKSEPLCQFAFIGQPETEKILAFRFMNQEEYNAFLKEYLFIFMEGRYQTKCRDSNNIAYPGILRARYHSYKFASGISTDQPSCNIEIYKGSGLDNGMLANECYEVTSCSRYISDATSNYVMSHILSKSKKNRKSICTTYAVRKESLEKEMVYLMI